MYRSKPEGSQSGKPNAEGEKIKVVSHWNIDYLRHKLARYHDQKIIQYLQFRFPIDCTIDEEADLAPPPNQEGARSFLDEIDGYISDLTLQMGLKNSAYICQRVTDVIMFIFGQEGYDGTNYLDDLAAAEVAQLAVQAYQILSDILEKAGSNEATQKAIPPSTCMLFLGILIDTILMRLSIDSERLKQIQEELQKWLNKKATTLKQLQSLVGKLNFCATVV